MINYINGRKAISFTPKTLLLLLVLFIHFYCFHATGGCHLYISLPTTTRTSTLNHCGYLFCVHESLTKRRKRQEVDDERKKEVKAFPSRKCLKGTRRRQSLQ